MKVTPLLGWIGILILMIACSKDRSHLLGSVSSSLLAPTFSIKLERPGVIDVVGSWPSSDFPSNAFRLRFDQSRQLMFCAESTVAKILGPQESLSVDATVFEIEEWTADQISTRTTQCGSSKRFVSYHLDLKKRSLTREFTGKSPQVLTLHEE